MTLTVCLLTFIGFSQNERIDDLTVKLAYQEADSTKVDLSLMLIDELYAIEDYEKALLYVNQTAKLSEKLEYSDPRKLSGISRKPDKSSENISEKIR